MFAANIKTGAMIVLLALTCSGSSAQPAPVLPAPPIGREPRLPDEEDDKNANKSAEKTFDAKLGEKMFPDGLTRDFGRVQHGTLVYHAFRVVNTSEVPLEILSVRGS